MSKQVASFVGRSPSFGFRVAYINIQWGFREKLCWGYIRVVFPYSPLKTEKY